MLRKTPFTVRRKAVYKKKPVKKTKRYIVSKLTRDILSGNVYRFTRRTSSIWSQGTTSVITSITSGANPATPSFYSLMPSLSELPAISDFTNLFDSYCVTGVKITFQFSYNSAQLTPTIDQSLPIMLSVVDTNDNTVPTTLDELREYRQCRVIHTMNSQRRTNSIYFKPKLIGFLSTSTVPSAYYEPKGIQWIRFDATTPTSNTRFYGVKLGIYNGYASSWTVDVKYYFMCRNTK